MCMCGDVVKMKPSIGNIHKRTLTKKETCIPKPRELNQASEVVENVPMTSFTSFLKMTAGNLKLFGNLHWLVIMKNCVKAGTHYTTFKV